MWNNATLMTSQITIINKVRRFFGIYNKSAKLFTNAMLKRKILN